MSELTVADELAWDALPDETRALCEKIIDARIEDDGDAREDMASDLEVAESENVRLNGVVKALEDQLTHHGITPDRKFGVPPATPTIDVSQLTAQPKSEAAD